MNVAYGIINTKGLKHIPAGQILGNGMMKCSYKEVALAMEKDRNLLQLEVNALCEYRDKLEKGLKEIRKTVGNATVLPSYTKEQALREVDEHARFALAEADEESKS